MQGADAGVLALRRRQMVRFQGEDAAARGEAAEEARADGGGLSGRRRRDNGLSLVSPQTWMNLVESNVQGVVPLVVITPISVPPPVKLPFAL